LRHRKHKRERSPFRTLTRRLEGIAGILLCLLLVATPWMYGTTLDSSINLMNIGSFIAGGILAACASSTAFTRQGRADVLPDNRWQAFYKNGFLFFNLLVLAFCAVALFNARATFSLLDQTFTYFEEYSSALPTTYDANATRQTLINWAAAFCAFWGLRYWILSPTKFHRPPDQDSTDATSALSNSRFRTILWILSINGLLISIQGILQRLSGSSKLLWLRKSYWGDPNSCFGPFSYRGNAVEYINLLWPVALGLWWILSRERRKSQGSQRLLTDGPELLLMPAVIVMVAAAFITLSRGGAIIAATTLVAALLVLVWQRKTSLLRWISSGSVLLAVIGLVFYLGVDEILKRFRDSSIQDLSGRTEIFYNSRKIASDFPRFGAGAGAFSSVYHLYREDTSQFWQAWVHDDWLETRVTMGWIGFTLVLLNLLFLFAWIYCPGKPRVDYVFTILLTIGLLGCLLKAKFDFPMQTYSIFYTFVAIASILTTVSPARR
jgi:hypothetical protein